AGFGVRGLVALSACGATAKMAESPAPDGEIESKLNLYSWGDYDSPDLLGTFNDDFDVLLQVDSYGSNEELIAKLSSSRGTSGYDVVVPTGSDLVRFTSHDLLQPLDMSLIPNFEHMDPTFIAQDFDPKNEYTICKAWGTTGYAYRTDVITRPMESWQDFIDAAQDEAAGRTSLLSDAWEVAAIGLAARGYSLNTTDEKELEEARTIIEERVHDLQALGHHRICLSHRCHHTTDGVLAGLHRCGPGRGRRTDVAALRRVGGRGDRLGRSRLQPQYDR